MLHRTDVWWSVTSSCVVLSSGYVWIAIEHGPVESPRVFPLNIVDLNHTYVTNYQRVNFYEITLNRHFPMVFLRFSRSFPPNYSCTCNCFSSSAFKACCSMGVDFHANNIETCGKNERNIHRKHGRRWKTNGKTMGKEGRIHGKHDKTWETNV